MFNTLFIRVKRVARQLEQRVRCYTYNIRYTMFDKYMRCAFSCVMIVHFYTDKISLI